MNQYIIAIDQSTSATKALLFDNHCQQLAQASVAHQQYYPKTGWVEHDAEEIYQNTVKAICQLTSQQSLTDGVWSIAITNQRETVVIWDKATGIPVCHALVWQDTRGTQLCDLWRRQGLDPLVQEHSGLKIDPNFCASKIRWILDNVEGCRERAEKGELLAGTIDCWLVWKLTHGQVFATDYTNASRTMLFNIHRLEWDQSLAEAFDIPMSLLPDVYPCDALYGETTVEGLFPAPIQIAGVLGDSHGALAGQMCFSEGTGKVTYGTGSSVMINIGTKPQTPPPGLVTSIGFSYSGTTYYAFEGNIYSTGATLKWLADQIHLIDHPAEAEALATSVEDNGGVYLIPAFSGLGAPWWQSGIKGAIFGMTFNTSRAHLVRAALESIAYQIKDLVDAMLAGTDTRLCEINADGGPTRNAFLMQLQADLLGTDIICTKVEDASALGAAVINGFARGLWTNAEEVSRLKVITRRISPDPDHDPSAAYAGWREAVSQLIRQ